MCLDLRKTKYLGNTEISESIGQSNFSSLSPPPLSAFSHLLKEDSRRNYTGETLDLAQLISSSCRQKIIETLSKVKQTHIMDLVRRVNSTYSQVNRNVQILERESIVSSHYHGRMRIIKLNCDNPKTVAMLKALRILKNQGTPTTRD
jgi:hypothetical protein